MSSNIRFAKSVRGDFKIRKAGLMNKKQGLPSSVGLGNIFSTHMKGRSGRNSQESREEMKNSYNKFNPQILKNQNQNEEEEEKEVDYLIEKKVGFGIPLIGSNTDSYDFFGNSVAITDNWAIVGARKEDSNKNGSDQGTDEGVTSSSGAAYIFKKKIDETWEEVAMLKASNANGNDYFGSSVAITDNWAIVGATGEDSSADGNHPSGSSGSGAAYIFKNNNGTWGTLNGSVYNETQILKASNGSNFDAFGRSVSISDNWAIVGAYAEDSNADGSVHDGANNSGAVYIFKNNNGTWGTQNGSVYKQTQMLKGNDPTKILRGQDVTHSDTSYDYFGSAVAITNNFAICGAPGRISSEDTPSTLIFNKLLDNDVWGGSTKNLGTNLVKINL